MKYIFDLDGTLLDTKGGDYAGAIPIIEHIEKVKELVRDGHTIVIQTARSNHWVDFTYHQLEELEIPYDILSVGQKIHGDIYVDDKAINSKDFFK